MTKLRTDRLPRIRPGIRIACGPPDGRLETRDVTGARAGIRRRDAEAQDCNDKSNGRSHGVTSQLVQIGAALQRSSRSCGLIVSLVSADAPQGVRLTYHRRYAAASSPKALVNPTGFGFAAV